MVRKFYDSHVHSCYSNDSSQTFSEICASALEKGLVGITITDHANMSTIEEDCTFENIVASVKNAVTAKRLLEGQLRVFCGVELSEWSYERKNTQKILESADFDVVIASVHKVQFDRWTDFYSKITFDETFSQEALYGFFGAYFEELLCVAEQEDYDVLAHLTCPLRYINGKYQRNFCLDPYEDVINEILRCLIRRDKSLEINTSGIRGIYDNLMPDLSIIQKYFAIGGRLITLGSDAHTPERLGNAFAETTDLLLEIGFPGYYHYEQRQPIFTYA